MSTRSLGNPFLRVLETFSCCLLREQKGICIVWNDSVSNCLSMTPEGRKEEVIAMFNRIIHSAFFKIDVSI